MDQFKPIPNAWVAEDNSIHHTPREVLFAIYDANNEERWAGTDFKEAISEWKRLSDMFPRLTLNGLGCGIMITNDELNEFFGDAKTPEGTSMCPICFNVGLHAHAPEEVNELREMRAILQKRSQDRYKQILANVAALESKYPLREPVFRAMKENKK